MILEGMKTWLPIFLLVSAASFVYLRSAAVRISDPRSAIRVTDANGQSLGSILDGIRPSKSVAQALATNEARFRKSTCRSAEPEKANFAAKLAKAFTVQTVLAQGCTQETMCYSHYIVLDINDCSPACPGFFMTTYADSTEADYSKGEHYDGTSSCGPSCTPICNRSICTSN
jgi:hypothetical protein